ncbi:histone-fold-containing protein [Collybia nuda]|uniref:Histone-fold-containing protein n=1 Tax=Collybia nuda TaxID=64659 RepID=A0A9P5Y669_9AGAR|nr:histone-fold-containing protein [Collybia nuda]
MSILATDVPPPEELGQYGEIVEHEEADSEVGEEDNEVAGKDKSHPKVGGKRKREKKDPVVLVREEGKSLLPFARVQRIIKADKDIPIITKDAIFLISLATEEFIKRITEGSQRVASREQRITVQHKDIATVVRKADEFMFLEEIIPWLASDPPAKRKLKGATGVKGAPTLLDQFVVNLKEDEKDGGSDIIMNDDGAMLAAGGEIEDEF